MAVKIFFCYAREDEPLLYELKAHLRPLQYKGLIDVWHDREISAGTEWEQVIKEQLNTAQIILLLISPAFMNSDYCYGVEMKKALERHNHREAQVIPVILRHVYWQGVLSNLQALPTDARPVKSWPDQDEAFYSIMEGIRKAALEIATPQLKAEPKPLQEKIVLAKDIPPEDSEVTLGVSPSRPGKERTGLHQDQTTASGAGDALFYLCDLFAMWTISGFLREDSEKYKYALSAFHSLLIAADIKNPAVTMLDWIAEAKKKASEALGLPKTEFGFLEFDTSGPYEALEVEESYFRLWKLALEKREPADMAKVRLALSRSVGEERQQELIGNWNKRLQ